MKFKVGDKVIAKENNGYSITNNGWRGVVIEVDGDWIRVKGPKAPDWGFTVESEHFEHVPDNQKIVITTDGVTTTAKLFDGKKLIKTAEAKCSPKDEFDFTVGSALALDRLIGNPDATVDKLIKVNRIGKVGEYVEVISEDGHAAKKGSILKVKRVLCGGWLLVFLDDDSNSVTTLRRSQYLVVENYKQDATLPEKKLFLKSTFSNELYGEVGSETMLRDINGEKLFVGDVVELFNEDLHSHGNKLIAHDNVHGDFVMGISYVSNTKRYNGKIVDGWKIIKRKSYTELTVDEKVDTLKVVER